MLKGHFRSCFSALPPGQKCEMPQGISCWYRGEQGHFPCRTAALVQRQVRAILRFPGNTQILSGGQTQAIEQDTQYG